MRRIARDERPRDGGGAASATIVRAAALLVALQLLTQGTNLLKQLVVAALFGTSARMDGYLVALGIVGLVGMWFSLPIRQVLIPMFRHDLANRGEEAAWASFNVLFNNLVLLLVVVVATAWLCAPALVDLMAPGFEEETATLATTLTRIVLPCTVFLMVGTMLSQVFYAYERFFVPGVVGALDNVVMIAALVLLAGRYGIYGLAAAVLLGSLSQMLVQTPLLWSKRRFSWVIDLRHPKVAEMGRLSFPLLLTTGGQELSRLSDRVFASLLPAGSLSALAYGGRLVSLVNDLVIDALQQSTFPHFSRLSAERQFATLSRQLFRYIRIMFFLTIPIAVGMVLLGDAIVAVVLQRGAFDAESTRLTSQALVCFALGFPASAAARVLNRTFFSLQDTWTPTKNAVLRFALKILLSAVLVWPLAHVGIALAESISHIVRLLPLFSQLPREVRGEEGGNTAKSVGRTLAAAAFMAVAVHLARGASHGILYAPIELAALVLLGGGAYVAAAFVLRADELEALWTLVRTQRRRAA